MNIKLLTLFVALVAQISCQKIHEFPGDTPNDPSLVDTEIALTLGIDVEMAVMIQTRSSYDALMADYDVRYVLDIYPNPTSGEASLGNRIQRIIHTERELHQRGYSLSVAKSLKLRPENYLVLVWVDFVPRGTVQDLHYDTHDLTAIKQISGNGFHLSKDAFCARATLELAPFKGQIDVHYVLKCPVERPFAMYEIVATDLAKYISSFSSSATYESIRPAKSALGYELYLPKGYSVRYDVPNLLTPNVRYDFNAIDSLNQNRVVLASDYVFVADSSSFYINMAVQNAQGQEVSTINGLKINLWRNRKTIIYGDFLTRGVDGGGIGIDGKFDKEIIVSI